MKPTKVSIAMTIDWTTLFAGLAIVVPLALFILQRQADSQRQLKELLTNRKFETYAQMQDVFWTIFKETGNYEKKGPHATALFEAQKRLYLYASDDVIRQFIIWRKRSSEGSLAGLQEFLQLVVDMRRDFMSKSTNITTDDILRCLMSDESEYEKIKKLIAANTPISEISKG